ncbi:putative methyltransferase [Lates japonicus]|uniref:Methyltransferase n=1 Tax=Lates japonicus TaxID=270547 RepID=A0AAD3MUS2_LATJO|nr:putative methyltransferase [Lates japonicus]
MVASCSLSAHLELQGVDLSVHLQRGQQRSFRLQAVVDLLTAVSSQWFDPSRGSWLRQSEVLKPRGCIALLGFTDATTDFTTRLWRPAQPNLRKRWV